MQVHRNDNIQNDEAFLTLLSSQRELLKELNRENAKRRVAEGSNSPSSGRRFAGVESTTAKNSFAFERRPSMEILTSKRLSLGLGNDLCVFPNLAFDSGLEGSQHSLGDTCSKHSLFEPKRSYKDCFEDFDPPVKRKKRRLSSLGFLSPSFFEDHLKTTSRRNSLASVSKETTKDDDETDAGDIIIETFDDEIRDDGITLEPMEPEQPQMEPGQIKSLIEAFRDAMERSQKTQQSIHDWDRKMGLKRSHSKTMRLSSRSRKKLRAVFKSELNALAAKL